MTRPVFLYRPDGRIDYAAMRNAVTKGTKTSRQINAAAERAATGERLSAVTAAIRSQVQSGFMLPPGKQWTVDVGALLLIGPAGAIGVSALMARTLVALSGSGRHDEARIVASAGCRDVPHLRELLAGIAGRLAAVDLRVDRRRTGIRIAKMRTAREVII